ncbi:YcaO-like family protein [Phyllobacterium sp. 0TCS1.6C]|uniref:YcaO-like family protein n=1 Tax=unclassified Phyllobacterium TaxID=2638441 RepID=UPI0022654CE1|nr:MULTISPECIES: YcaO-like family protein [unclassified Phyllobacterium]MCX8279947.1 YcaO-like family protein [Phyllobacterium sp. 0TCS1.6C]MCX8296114.1 YcaO-like family protein [Phyllobacterium sp. 0TCS1.6A]
MKPLDVTSIMARLAGDEARLVAAARSDSLSSARLQNAATLVERLRPHFPRLGIVRIADMTGLDRIGIPVWMAVRPNSRTLAVSQGKGMSAAHAQASAVMEAAEIAIAENIGLPRLTASRRELIEQGNAVFDGRMLLMRDADEPAMDEPVDWLQGHDLIKQSPVMVPHELVTLDFTTARRAFHYTQSTDGLASGNCLLEAVIHGLCERVERDAIELWRFRKDAAVEANCVDPAALRHESIDGLAHSIKTAGFELRLFDISSDIGLPVFMATISPRTRHESYLHFDLAAGYGCHLSPTVAAMRAITEAAQTRITNISGARDDFDPAEYAQRLAPDLAVYINAAPLADFAFADAMPQDKARLECYLAPLRASGIGSVVVVPLGGEEFGISVCRVLVNELESPVGMRKHRFGGRALTALLRH